MVLVFNHRRFKRSTPQALPQLKQAAMTESTGYWGSWRGGRDVVPPIPTTPPRGLVVRGPHNEFPYSHLRLGVDYRMVKVEHPATIEHAAANLE